jgi:hypothetical protein
MMREKAPPTKRRFRNAWDQIDYLYHKALFWFYERCDRRQAMRFARRLKRLVAKTDPQAETILGMSCRALIAELEGDLRKAIQCREREIEFIERFLRDGIVPGVSTGYDDVSDSMDLLAIHYWDLGDLTKALEILDQSKRYCAEHGIPFDGQDIVDEVHGELKAASRNGVASQRSGKRS